MDYTPEQAHAIERRKGELLLDAGAGSGKTSVLVERFVRAVREDGIPVGQLLTITFTEKAAAELRERIRARLRAVGDHAAAQATEGAWISTIHAFCARLLRTHALEAGVDPEFTVLDENAAAPLRRGAFQHALALRARGEAGAELIAAHGPAQLRQAILETHAELSARGMRVPSLPPVEEPVSALDLQAAVQRVLGLAAAAGRELGRARKPGTRVSEALLILEHVPAVLEDPLPWPGDLRALRLGNGASALKSEACGAYNDALDEFGELVADALAAETRAELEALLRDYGARYAALKRERGAVDFADLELMAHALLSQHEIGSRYQERFARVMVDEMQDTNRVQLDLIELVAGLDLFMVGDAQQSIYGFRHADVELFQERGERLGRVGARASLETNFRSRPEILTALNAAFTDALGAGFRPLRPGREDPPARTPAVELLIVDKAAIGGAGAELAAESPAELDAVPWRVAEARALAARIAELIAARSCRAGDVVLLTRATTDMHVYERALERLGVATYVIGGRGYWSHPQVAELIAYLRALANPLDTEALYTVFLSPLCGLSLDGLVLGDAAAADELGPADRERLETFDGWFREERRRAAWSGPEELLERALERTGYDVGLVGLADGRRRLANVRKLMRLAREWQAAHGSDLRGFVDSLAMRRLGGEGARESEAPVESESLDAVRLMTIHRSKGLEFPVVCVADLGRGNGGRRGQLVRVSRDGERLGLRLKRAGYAERISALDYDELAREQQRWEQAEERRLFYVAMTRARERLILSGAAGFEDWERANQGAPIGWIGAAFVPDIASRAHAAARSGGGPFLTRTGVSVRLIDQLTPAESVAITGPGSTPAPAGPAGPANVADAVSAVERDAPVFRTLSYSALASYERCAYRFYAERVLGLPETPPIARAPTPDAPALPRQRLSGAARGTLVHELLAGLDFKRPSLRETMPADVRGLLTALVGSATFLRLAGLRDVRREQAFAFAVDELLITGVFDLIGRERRADHLLVVDYKSDRLGPDGAEAVVGERYMAQRAIYALAALKLGAAVVEVAHVFLEAPEDPVTAVFTAAQAQALEDELRARLAGPLSGRYPVSEHPGRRVCEGCPARGGLCSHPLERTTGG